MQNISANMINYWNCPLNLDTNRTYLAYEYKSNNLRSKNAFLSKEKKR